MQRLSIGKKRGLETSREENRNHERNASPLTTDGTMQLSIVRALIASSNFHSPLARRPAAPLRNARWKGRKKTKGGRNCSCAALIGTAREYAIRNFSYCLPVLPDVERPLELQVLVLVVVGEHG